MADITLDSDQLKELLKLVIVEPIQDNPPQSPSFVITQPPPSFPENFVQSLMQRFSIVQIY
jgi:hypothetical protein